MTWFARLERAVASPGAILALMRANYEIDVSDLLPSIRVPTLILHRAGDALVPVEAGRYLARHIRRARYVELPGDDHMLQALDRDVLDTLLDEVDEFITGRRRHPEPDQIPPTLAAADAECGGPNDALAELERCREILACGEDGGGLAGVVARAEALAAAARGSWSESEAQFLKAAETFRRHGMVWQEAETFRRWGHALRAAPDRRAAIEKLDRAIEIHRRLDASGGHGAECGPPRTDGGAPEPAASPGAVFRREGDYWTMSWQGNVVRLRDAKGLYYIAQLLADPGRQVLACELATAQTTSGTRCPSIDRCGTATDLGDAGPVLDAKAREQYRRRIGEVREELGEAARLNDTQRETRLRSELESLQDQIVAAVGLGGRNRKAASQASGRG
jgi:tetratricopeptide (TPR) repeat protein